MANQYHSWPKSDLNKQVKLNPAVLHKIVKLKLISKKMSFRSLCAIYNIRLRPNVMPKLPTLIKVSRFLDISLDEICKRMEKNV